MLVSVTEDMKMSKPSDLVQGTLDMLLLKILAPEPMNGFAVSQRLKQVSGDVLQVSDGSLYSALHKLEQEGWITAEWKTSEYGRRAKYYSPTRLGRRQLEKEADNLIVFIVSLNIDSANIWRNIRPRLAPSAERTAISCCRPEARAKRRLAILSRGIFEGTKRGMKPMVPTVVKNHGTQQNEQHGPRARSPGGTCSFGAGVKGSAWNQQNSLVLPPRRSSPPGFRCRNSEMRSLCSGEKNVGSVSCASS
jgi:PadR family transcriptional regulator, regulatory protein PadR